MDRWLDAETAQEESQGLIDEVRDYIDNRLRGPYFEGSAQWVDAAHAIRRRWFNASIGLAFDGEQEPLFLPAVKGANLVGRQSIVTSTHWLGSLFAELREAVLKG